MKWATINLEVMPVYPRLRDLREDSDRNQTDLAKLLGMSQTGYSKYETGENQCPVTAYQKMTKLYQATIDELLGEYLVNNCGCPYPFVTICVTIGIQLAKTS